MLTTLTNDKENCSDETQQQPLKRPKTTNSTNVEGSDEDEYSANWDDINEYSAILDDINEHFEE